MSCLGQREFGNYETDLIELLSHWKPETGLGVKRMLYEGVDGVTIVRLGRDQWHCNLTCFVSRFKAAPRSICQHCAGFVLMTSPLRNNWLVIGCDLLLFQPSSESMEFPVVIELVQYRVNSVCSKLSSR
jgi:hypothetical protein